MATNPRPRVIQAGRLVDFNTGELGNGLTGNIRAGFRPSDRLELKASYGLTRLDGAPGNRSSLTEIARQLTATYYISNRCYVFANYENDVQKQWYPFFNRITSRQQELRFVWQVSRDLATSAGVKEVPGVDRFGHLHHPARPSTSRSREHFASVPRNHGIARCRASFPPQK